MRNEWANIDEKKRTRLEEALDKRENPPQIYNEDWYEKVKQLLEVLRLEAHSEELPVQLDRIHVNNGTYFLDGRFTEEKDFCLNRLPVNYEGREPEPVKWKRFLSELLETVMWVVSRRWSITVLQGQIWNTGF